MVFASIREHAEHCVFFASTSRKKKICFASLRAMQKFGEHEQASTRLNFASKSSKGKILRAVKNFNGPFITSQSATGKPVFSAVMQSMSRHVILPRAFGKEKPFTKNNILLALENKTSSIVISTYVTTGISEGNQLLTVCTYCKLNNSSGIQ